MGEKKVLRNKQASSTPTLTDTVPEAEPNESAFGGGWSAPYSSHCFIFPSLFPTVYCRHDVRTVSTETQWELVRVVVTVSMFAWYTVKYNPECLWVLSGDRTSGRVGLLCQPAQLRRSYRCTGMQSRMKAPKTRKSRVNACSREEHMLRVCVSWGRWRYCGVDWRACVKETKLQHVKLFGKGKVT